MSENAIDLGGQKEQKKENAIVRFFVSLIWLAISLIVDFWAVKTESLVAGAVIELIFFAVTFCVPYLRKKGTYTRWWGWLALMQAAWLLYLKFGG